MKKILFIPYVLLFISEECKKVSVNSKRAPQQSPSLSERSVDKEGGGRKP